MSDQLFNNAFTLAGFEFPSVCFTLQHFISLCQKSKVNKTELVSAIELDPSLLAVFLGFTDNSDISKWHVGTKPEYFKQVALTLGNQFSSRKVSENASKYFYSRWQRSLVHSNLCCELAKTVSEDVSTYKLLGLMAGIGHHIFAKTSGETYFHILKEATNPALLVAAEQQQFGFGGNELGANMFKSWGYSSNHADAIRFQYADLDELQDASLVVKIVAYARRLSDQIRNSTISDLELLTAGSKLFNVNDAAVNKIVSNANLAFSKNQEGMLGKKKPENFFQVELANANISAAIEKNLSFDEQSIARTANLIFGIQTTLFFKVNGNQLQSNFVNDEVLSVDRTSERSQLALSYQQNKLITATEKTLNSIFDKQLLDRLNANAIWFLPLGREIGVLVCGMAQNRVPIAPLLKAFQLAASEQFGLILQDQVPKLDAEFVRKRVSEVTHEANNPLSIVQNYLRSLSLKLDKESPVQADIETISREMMRISTIVQKYSEIGRQDEVLTQEINVNNILTSLASVFRGGYEYVNFELNLDKAMPPLIVITADSFKQVIINIIKNAVEALHQTSEANIVISSDGSINLGGQQYIEIQISDNGPGIPSSIKEKLFQPFNNEKSDKNSGLGLSIVNKLVAQMGGLISCKSKIVGKGNAGTTFQILLPLINSQE